jgi:hypothetical protein
MLKNKLPIILLIFSIFIIFYTFFQSEIILNGKMRTYYYLYYKISGILILFSIITFYLNKKLKEYLVIIISSFIFAIYAFQTYLTISYQGVTGSRHIEKKISRAKREGIKFEYRGKFEVYKELKNNKYITLKVATSPLVHIDKGLSILPLAGVSNSITINCNENGYYTLFKSDRYGFNNLDTEWDQKEIEFFLIGDSFVLGNCVNRPHDISSVLKKISNKSVVNIGYANNGPLIEYAALREYFLPKIKNIIWIYYETSDLNNLRTELNSKILRRYIDDMNFKQNLIYKQNEINDIVNKSINEESERESNSKKYFEDKLSFKVKKFLNLWNVRELLFYSNRFKNKTEFNPPKEFKKIIELAKNLANKNNSNFHFVYLPSYHRYVKKIDNQEYRFIKKIINDLNINFIDIHDKVFKKEKNPLKLFPFELPGHYTVDGYRKVGEAIFNNVQ